MTNPLKLGEPAPAFNLVATDPANISAQKQFTLDDFSGRFLVLYFYPRDNTPGCTTQAISFTEHLTAFEAENTSILGVSADSMASHRKFTEKKDLGSPLGRTKVWMLAKPTASGSRKKCMGRPSWEYKGLLF